MCVMQFVSAHGAFLERAASPFLPSLTRVARIWSAGGGRLAREEAITMQGFLRWQQLEEESEEPISVPADARSLTDALCELADRALRSRDWDEHGDATPILGLVIPFLELVDDPSWEASQRTQYGRPWQGAVEHIRHLVDLRRLIGSYIFKQSFRDGDTIATQDEIRAAVRRALADAERIWAKE
jgi:hypothetical protein